MTNEPKFGAVTDEKLAKIANATEHTVDDIVRRALAFYLQNEGGEILQFVRGQEQLGAGESVDFDDVISELEAIIENVRQDRQVRFRCRRDADTHAAARVLRDYGIPINAAHVAMTEMCDTGYTDLIMRQLDDFEALRKELFHFGVFADISAQRTSPHYALWAWQKGEIGYKLAMELTGCESVEELAQRCDASGVPVRITSVPGPGATATEP